LTFALGGTSAGQSGQLTCSNANLSGPLFVYLTNGYAPSVGDQFQILTCSNRIGTFSATNIPPSMILTYKTNGVFLAVAGPVQALSPQWSNGFAFSFQTALGQSYTIQTNNDLTTTNWGMAVS
jgi:hypothetical protein